MIESESNDMDCLMKLEISNYSILKVCDCLMRILTAFPNHYLFGSMFEQFSSDRYTITTALSLSQISQ